MAFPSFHSGEALAVIGTGRAPAELLVRSFAMSPGTRSKKVLMMPHLPSLTAHRLHGDFMSNHRTNYQSRQHLENKGSESGIFARQSHQHTEN